MLAKLIGAALKFQRGRYVVLTDAENFHSDLYILDAIAEQFSRPIEVRRIDRNPMLIDMISMDAVKMAIVQVIDVAGVFHRWMLAGPVDMIVGSMGFVVRHRIHRWKP